MDTEPRLRIAIQKAGRLTDNSLDLLVRCGLKYSRGKDQLMCYGENMPLDLLFVRDDDIPDLVQEDVCDLGIVRTQRDGEKRLDSRRAASTPASSCRQARVRALPTCDRRAQDMDYGGLATLGGRRIATTYPNVLGRYLRENSVDAEIVTLSGSVEIAPRLGRADVICDLVATGSTLAANHLREVATVLDSQAALIRTPVRLPDAKADWVRRLLVRIDGVQQVRESKYIMLHAPRSALPQIKRLLPGSESPTVIPLEGTGDKVAVHAVCRENVFWETLESLKAAGASAVLVLPVEKMLA
jgi:ATP phosphoribosyltransferase